MGNSGWTNDDLDTIVLPPGALPGQTRLVIGPELPPPLDTYLVAGLYPYNTGIIFYSATPTDDDFLFLCQVQFPSTHQVHFGAVVDGAVSEIAAGVPRTFKWAFGGGGDFFSEYDGTYFRFGQTSEPDNFEPDPILLPCGTAMGWGVIAVGNTPTGSITTGGAETAMTTAAWNLAGTEPQFVAVPDHVYRVTYKGNFFVSGGVIATAFGIVRIRLGQQTTAGTLLMRSYVEARTNLATFTANGDGVCYYTGTTVETRYLSLTLAKNAGGGSQINMGSDSEAQIVVEIEDLGHRAYVPQYDGIAVPFS
jgi:hypothetical protein